MSLCFGHPVCVLVGSSAAPIRFRTEATSAGASPVQALLLAALLLAVLLVVLLWAKRRGWLKAWLRDGTQPASTKGVEVLGSTRLSRSTVIHDVQWHKRRLLLVESSGSAQVRIVERGADAHE